ncbi:MAG: AMP-binding protein [Gammaproteobacteria bacterium]|nr:AMP-binding protein [Gammaproteobacteria bacterium]
MNNIQRAANVTVGDLLRVQAHLRGDQPAVIDGEVKRTYAAFNQRVNQLANDLIDQGIVRGDRVAILSENRMEFLELIFAAAKIGVIVAAQNWRLAADELSYCLDLVAPKAALVSEKHQGLLNTASPAIAETALRMGERYEARLAVSSPTEPDCPVELEDGLIILYTSGTTGRPKGALISHRAMIARFEVMAFDCGLSKGDTTFVWPPMFHMSGTDASIGALISGGQLIISDGPDVDRMVDAINRERLGRLSIMPGMIQPLIKKLRERDVRPKGIKQIGAMADLVPPREIAEITQILNAPYTNTFGATETGLAPASAGLLEIGVPPQNLAKTQTSFCAIKLVDEHDNEVPDGQPGELAIRSATMFSGYWNADEVNAQDFRGGWFHMGDVFVRNPDGTLSFVDRVKYLIKSGGENIYPAEIERVIMADPRVSDAVVVRQDDKQWGEVPVAFVSRHDDTLNEAEIFAWCREQLAGYKQPKAIHFVAFDRFPRSTTGKIQRHEVESWL